MLIDERRQQVARAVESIRGLSREEQRAIAALDLPVYDSLVVAHLKLARHLLERDSDFDWKARETTWHAWREEIIGALDGALRYRENESLVVTVAVCVALFPAVHQGAQLLGYKILNDVVSAAQRAGYDPKRERVRHRTRLIDMIQRVTVWLCPPNQLIPDHVLTPLERATFTAQEATESWGLTLDYYDAVYVMHIVEAIVPILWQRHGDVTVITPLKS